MYQYLRSAVSTVETIAILLITIVFTCWHAICADAASYGIARSATPVLNTPQFSSVFGGPDGATLNTDRCGQVRELEFIALPGTVFSIGGVVKAGAAEVFRVNTDDYPVLPGTGIYVDSRFIELHEKKPLPRPRRLLPSAGIIRLLRGAIGSPYVWGGNVQGGVAELMKLFYGGHVPNVDRNRLTLAGLDCSGLLYYATGGWTPRNTSDLVSYGHAVPVAGQPADAIARLLEPLDLIVWKGHVLIVLDSSTVIESRLECEKPGRGGVVTTVLAQRLRKIMKTRKPADQWPTGAEWKGAFVVRRWI